VVGHVLDCEGVEGTHLHLTHVDVGEDEPLQIVCGAPNVAAGEDVIVALHGARIAGNEKIKKGKIRGMESYGMICGLQEIGFSDSVVRSEERRVGKEWRRRMTQADAEDGIRCRNVTGVQTCALPI